MNKETSEALILEYIKSSGELFHIELIDIVRDGGTKVLRTNKPDSKNIKQFYYIHKEEFTIHDAYPVSDSNILQDKLLNAYLLDRITAYVVHLEFKAEVSRNILSQIISTQKKQQ